MKVFYESIKKGWLARDNKGRLRNETKTELEEYKKKKMPHRTKLTRSSF